MPDLKDLIALVTDGYSLMKHREDIRDAVSGAIDAGAVAAVSAAKAAADASVAAGKIKLAKDLILRVTQE